LVNLVPETGKSACVQVAGDQGSLACACRCRKPDYGSFKGVVEPAEELLAGKHLWKERPRDFGKRSVQPLPPDQCFG
jgi:hypothetical protein